MSDVYQTTIPGKGSDGNRYGVEVWVEFDDDDDTFGGPTYQAQETFVKVNGEVVKRLASGKYQMKSGVIVNCKPFD